MVLHICLHFACNVQRNQSFCHAHTTVEYDCICIMWVWLNCCFFLFIRGIKVLHEESPILPRNIAGIVSRTSSGIPVSAVNSTLRTVIYRTPLLFPGSTSVVLGSTGLSIMESLIVLLDLPMAFQECHGPIARHQI